MTTLRFVKIGHGTRVGDRAVTIPIPVPEGAMPGDLFGIQVEAEGVACDMSVDGLAEDMLISLDNVCVHEWRGRLSNPVEASFRVVFHRPPTGYRIEWLCWRFLPGGSS